MKKNFQKVLIANRGEIACRLISACKTLGLKSVAIYSDADQHSRHVRLADEAVLIGPGPSQESYLNVNKILEIAKASGAQAVHPGYGFLSERAHFAQAVLDAKLVWVGPSPQVISLMGNKIAAKKAAEKAKVPTAAWAILKGNWTIEELKKSANNVGFPLLLKAAAGGGGRGMRLVSSADELEEKAQSAMREAQSAFGSSEIFLEAYIGESRHIEVQVLGDEDGHVITLGERECSIQRRHQKVIEEAPAPTLSDKTRKALWKAAQDLAKSVNYTNAGTCEFLVDEKEKFYFLEMNTRLQVEHPVTELVWGVDLPVLQLKIASGEALPADIQSAKPNGHAIEVRLYAENPAKNFMPSPGKLDKFEFSHLPGLRLDAGYESNSEIPIYYDAMMAKLISWGMDREQARRKLLVSINEAKIEGVACNKEYLSDILKHKDFIQGSFSTQFLDKTFKSWNGQVLFESDSNVQSEAVQDVLISPWLAFLDSEKGNTGAIKKRSKKSSLHYDADKDFSAQESGKNLVSEHPGKVLKINVKVGQKVEKGQTVIVCESMKMEFSYAAQSEHVVKSIHVQEGQVVAAGTVFVEWEEQKS